MTAIRDLKETKQPKEHKEQGQVKRNVYTSYIKAASALGFAGFIACIALSQGTAILGNVVLKSWASKNSENGKTSSVMFYLSIYGVSQMQRGVKSRIPAYRSLSLQVVGLASSLLSVGATIILWIFCAISSSRKLHDDR